MFRSDYNSRKNDRRQGVTRLEVLVVVLIVAAMAELGAPAICQLREGARRNQCSGNLQQLSQSLTYYQDQQGFLPQASTWEGSEIDLSKMPLLVDTVPNTFENWIINLLPHLDLEEVRDTFDIGKPMIDQVNSQGRNMRIQVLICPTDAYSSATNAFKYTVSEGVVATFSRGNYALNGGPQFVLKGPGTLMDPRPLVSTFCADDCSHQFQWWGEGVGGFNKRFSMREFTNGLSHLVAINEVRAGLDPSDCRGVWALGQIGSSVTWGHGILSDAGGPNPALENADDILNGSSVHNRIGSERIKQENMPFCDHCNFNTQAGSRSMHPGGVNVVFCDGQTRFISDAVDQSIWHAMHSRNTPREVLADVAEEMITGTRTVERKESPLVLVGNAKVNMGQRILVNSVQMSFSLIPAGTFMMGLQDEGANHMYPEDVPAHEVTISQPFYMGQFEVTQAQYKGIMGKNPSSFIDGNKNGVKLSDTEITKRPVENVSWNEAVDFCQKLSGLAAEKQVGRTYRMPTEAEWEYCCRSGSSQAYKFNGQWTDEDNSGEIARKVQRKDPPATMPVGSYHPNAFGLYDMRGNVWEWCRDWFQHDYYSWSSRTDPQGPADGVLKVYRGCDWIYSGDDCKTANRCLPPEGKSPFIGFRVVCEFVNPEKSP